jgi:plastocyanin
MEFAAQLRLTPFNWRRMMDLAVFGNVIILLMMAIGSGVTFALGLAAIYLIGWGLTRFRSGWVGMVIVGLLSIDIAAWTLSGAVSNFLSGEKISALIQPAYLGVISLAGFTAAVASWITRKDPNRGAEAAAMSSQGTLAILLLIAIAGMMVGQGTARATQPTDLAIKTENMAFSQKELFSDSEQVTLHLSNNDLWWHTFTIDELGVNLVVPMGAEREITFSAEPGEYQYYCNIPGHEGAMHGTLIISGEE